MSCDGGLLRREACQLSALTINANSLKPHGIPPSREWWNLL